MGYEKVGEEGREEVEEEDEYDYLHSIEWGIEVLRVLDIFTGGDETDDIGIIYEEKWSDSNPEYEEYLIGFCYVFKERFCIELLNSFREKWKHGIEEQSSEHHPDFYYLHGNRVEGDGDICDSTGFENREEDDINFEVDDIQKKGNPIGEGSPENMFHIYGIESKPDGLNPSGIEIEESRHNDIPEKSCEKYGDEPPELQARIIGHKPFWKENEDD